VPGVVNADDGIAGSSHALHRCASAGARCGGADRGEEGRLVDVEEALLVVPILIEDAHRE
jgi:hypothetical protein